MLKHDTKGVSAVCKVMQQYETIARVEGRNEGMSQLANAIQDLKAGASKEDLLIKYDKKTVELAISCR